MGIDGTESRIGVAIGQSAKPLGCTQGSGHGDQCCQHAAVYCKHPPGGLNHMSAALPRLCPRFSCNMINFIQAVSRHKSTRIVIKRELATSKHSVLRLYSQAVTKTRLLSVLSRSRCKMDAPGFKTISNEGKWSRKVLHVQELT